MYKEFIRFVRDYYKTDQLIPLHAPSFSDLEKKYLLQVIESTYVSSVGPLVDELESKIAKYTGAKFAIATVNGTSALHVALKLAGVEEDDEVITQSLTFVGTANAIRYCGANPLFVDIEQSTLGMSPDALKNHLESNTTIEAKGCINKKTGRRISACVPMHTFGHPVRIDEIIKICEHYQISVVEDAAEALGSFYQERHAGTFGKLGILSFNGNKIITSGGGGMILTNDSNLALRAKHLTTTAKVAHQWDFVHDEVGFNYRMPNLNAALGVAQLERLNQFLIEKKKLANLYQAYFKKTETLFVEEPTNAQSNHWLNAIILPSQQARDQFLDQTNKAQVQTRPAWTPMHLLPMYKECGKGTLDTTEYVYKHLVSLPSSAPQSFR